MEGLTAIAPPHAVGSFGISYGVLIGTTPDKSDTSAALAAATDRLIRQLGKARDLKPEGPTSNLQIAGRPVVTRELSGISPISDAGISLREHDWLVTIGRPDGTTAYLLFVAPQPDYATLQPLYDSMLLTFRPQ